MLRLARATQSSAASSGLFRRSLKRCDKTNLTYSEVGPFTTYSIRQRYPTYLQCMTDATVTDFFYGKWVTKWFEDACSMNYWWGTVLGFVASTLYMLRQLLFNPDVFFRKQESRLIHPDRFRQNCYCLPFFNHRMRNWSQKLVWMTGPNEMDWKDECESGLRPVRMQCHRLPLWWSIWHWSMNYKYLIEDSLFTTNSYKSKCLMYHKMGYRIDPALDAELACETAEE